MSFKKIGAAAAVCAAVITASVLGGCSADNIPAVTQEVLTPVEVTALGLSSIKKEMAYAGQVSAAESVNVISKVTGKVLSVYYDIGDTVNAGDVLFKLDEKDIKDQLKQVEAQITQAEQGIKQAENSVNAATGGQYQSQVLQQETNIESYGKQLENALIVLDNAKTAIDNAETIVANAEIGLENAKKSYEVTASQFENTKVLYDAGLVAQNDFDRAKLGYEQAQSQLTQAEAGLRQARNGYTQAVNASSQAQISYDTLILAQGKAMEGLELTTSTVAEDNKRQAKLAVESAKASRDILLVQKELIENTLRDTAVTSPISGVISGRGAKENEYVSSQAPAYTIVNINSVYVDVKVSEIIINNIFPGSEVEVYLAALDGGSVSGIVKTVSPAADQTGTFPVKIEIANPDNKLKPGMFAEARFIKEHSENTLILPRSAVLTDESGAYVFTEQNGYAVKTPVILGVDNGKEVEILNGLKEGDRIITKGQSYVADNEKLNVVAVLGD